MMAEGVWWVVVLEGGLVPKLPKHLRRLKSQLKQSQMQWLTKWVMVAEVGGGYAEYVVDGLCKDVKMAKI